MRDITPGASPTLPQHGFNLEGLPWEGPAGFKGLPVAKGYLRQGLTTLSAQTDGEAVAAWLAEKAMGSPHTADRYRREAERLLMWAASRGKALSELTRDDFVLFRQFLENPSPAEDWIAPARYPRSDYRWRPFLKGPLSRSSRQGCLTITYSLICFLTNSGWLAANPMPQPKSTAVRRPSGLLRSLSARQMEAVHEVVEANPNPAARARLRWIMTLAAYMAPRSSDYLEHTMSSFITVTRGNRTKWMWLIEGKGHGEDMLPVPDIVINELTRFRTFLGLPPYPAPDEYDIPLVPNINRLPRKTTLTDQKTIAALRPHTQQPISRSGLYRLIKTVFSKAADLLDERYPGTSDGHRLRQASGHWLRHTTIKRVFDRTKSLPTAQFLARHRNLNTTGIYAASGLDELADTLDDLYS